MIFGRRYAIFFFLCPTLTTKQPSIDSDCDMLPHATPARAHKNQNRHLSTKMFFPPFQRRGRVRRPYPLPITPQNILCKQPHTKCFKIKGQGGTREQTRSPLVAQQQLAHQLRTTKSNGEKRREQERVVTMSTASTVKGPVLRQDSLATKRLRKASRWRGLHLLLRGQLR